MAWFRRNRDEEGDLEPTEADQGPTEASEDAEGLADVEAPDGSAESDAPEPVRTGGPWDQADAPDDDQARLDLGALRVPGFPGMEVRLDVDRDTERLIAATAVAKDGLLQLQGFAAPRSGGLWREVRSELVAGIVAAGGSVTEGVGPFGAELVAQVPAEDGSAGLQPARFVGADGARWFLRGVFTGSAAAPGETAELLERVFEGTVVVRGDQAMAPRDLLTLTMPSQAAAQVSVPAGEGPEPERPPLEPFRRGPEITEIH